MPRTPKWTTSPPFCNGVILFTRSVRYRAPNLEQQMVTEWHPPEAYFVSGFIDAMRIFNAAPAWLVAVFLTVTDPGSTAKAQTQGMVQPWGLPPLPAGIGPVEKFADVGNTPRGQFLEGGAFDTQGNLWFVAIGSGWVSYLTPDAKLVPVFNCNPPADLGQTCEPRGTRWHEGKLYLTTRHSDLRSANKVGQHSGLHLP
jgi:hypothetical protein